jgi:hypothetical protein
MDNRMYKSLMEKFLELSLSGKLDKALEVMILAQNLAKKGDVTPSLKLEQDSQCYFDLMGNYKSLSFQGDTPLAKKVLTAAEALTLKGGSISDDAFYAGAAI